MGGAAQGLRAAEGLHPRCLGDSKPLVGRELLRRGRNCLEGLHGEALLLRSHKLWLEAPVLLRHKLSLEAPQLLRHKLWLEVTLLLLKLLDLLWSQLLRRGEAEALPQRLRQELWLG